MRTFFGSRRPEGTAPSSAKLIHSGNLSVIVHICSVTLLGYERKSVVAGRRCNGEVGNRIGRVGDGEAQRSRHSGCPPLPSHERVPRRGFGSQSHSCVFVVPSTALHSSRSGDGSVSTDEILCGEIGGVRCCLRMRDEGTRVGSVAILPLGKDVSSGYLPRIGRPERNHATSARSPLKD